MRRCFLFFKASRREFFNHFWPFFGIIGHICTLAHRIFSFLLHRYWFHMHVLQNHQKKSWDWTFNKVLLVFKVSCRAVFWLFLALFWYFLVIFLNKDIQYFTCSCIATDFICMCLRIINKNLGTRPLTKCYCFSVSSRAVFYCFWSFFGIFWHH